MNTVLWFLFEFAINVFQSVLFTTFMWGCLRLKPKTKYPRLGFALCVSCMLVLLEFFTLITYFEGIAIFVYIVTLFLFSVLYFEDDILKKMIISVLPLNASAIGSIVSALTRFIISASNNHFIQCSPFFTVMDTLQDISSKSQRSRKIRVLIYACTVMYINYYFHVFVFCQF